MEPAQLVRIVDRIADRYNVGVKTQGPLRQSPVTRGAGQKYDPWCHVGPRARSESLRLCTHGSDYFPDPIVANIVEHNPVDARDSQQLTGRPATHNAATNYQNVHVYGLTQIRAGKLSPTAVLGRNTAGTAEAKNSSDHPGDAKGQKSTTECIHVGLAGIEPATFTLSV